MNFDKIVPVLEVLNKFASRSTEIRDIRELAMEVEHILEDEMVFRNFYVSMSIFSKMSSRWNIPDFICMIL